MSPVTESVAACRPSTAHAAFRKLCYNYPVVVRVPEVPHEFATFSAVHPAGGLAGAIVAPDASATFPSLFRKRGAVPK